MRFTWALGVLLLCVVPAKADNIGVLGDAAFSNLVFNGQTFVADLGVVESVDTSFIYNTTSQRMSNVNFNSNGPLGPFTFLGINQLPFNSGGSGISFDWVSSQAELVLDITRLPTQGGPATGQGTKNLDMLCLTQSCNDDFGGTYSFIGDAESFTSFTWLSADSPSDTPSPTPEPSSLALMGIGLVGIVSLRKLIA